MSARLFVLKFALATWLLVVSTSPAFAHDHVDGDKPHRHGLGFLPGSTPALLWGGEDGVAPSSRHFHLVILGIELHVPATCPFVQLENPSLLADRGFFQLGSEIATGITHVADDAIPDYAAAEASGTELWLVPQDPASEPALDLTFLLVLPLCDLARGLRSGAQQI